MTLAINEIDIQMRISEQADEQARPKNIAADPGRDNLDFDAVVAKCTRMVLQHLTELQAR
jgi:hypothetical protein